LLAITLNSPRENAAGGLKLVRTSRAQLLAPHHDATVVATLRRLAEPVNAAENHDSTAFSLASSVGLCDLIGRPRGWPAS
jgi:hypothetical protein